MGANKIDAKRHRIQIGSIATEKLGQVIEERTRFFEKKRGKKLLTWGPGKFQHPV